MLNKLAPFFTLIFSALFLREKTTLKQYLFVIGAFVGTLFIVKPSGGLTQEAFASFMGVFGGLTAGAAYTLVRYLGKRKMPSCQIVFIFSLFSTLAAIPFVIKDHQAMSMQQIILLVIASLGATTGQFCITLAYKAAPSKEISIFDYFSVVFSAIFGFVFLGQVPDVFSFVGYMIIFLMAYLMFLYNRRK
jgi:drug/metabolite transporter (DMT)-like permease